MDWVAQQLDKYPNYYIDIDARIHEIGRRPYTARKMLIKYQDRILFGTDTRPDVEAYRTYYQFLETEDEYIDVAKSHHLQGRWKVNGMYLPDEVLEKIYYRNAVKLIPGAKGR
jgi:predicted TIM-barrel fold metal-dependent hydrolase